MWRPEVPGRRGRLFDAATIVITLAVLVVSGWMLGLLVQHLRIDEPITDWVVRRRSSGATWFARRVTDLGDARVLVPVTVFTWGTLGVAGGRRVRSILVPWFALVGSTLISQVVKHIVERPRPSTALRAASASGFAFPSGHTIEAIAVWGAACILLSTLVSGWPRIAIRVVGAVVIVAVGLSRVYLGVHWTTDVLGGWLLGGVWLAVLFWRLEYSEG